MHASQRRLASIACRVFMVLVLLAAAKQPAAAAAETDDIATNLDRTDETLATKGLGFLEDLSQRRKQWRERIGLDTGVTYHTLFMAALLGDGVPVAAGGDLTLQGIWSPGKNWREDPLQLRFRLRHRHAFGDTAPSGLDEELGALWGVTDGFSDRGFEVPDFYFRQKFAGSGLELRYGQMTIHSLLDSHALEGAKQSFINQAFSSNPAVAFPRFGAGFTLAKEFDNGLDLTIGATNVQGTENGGQVDFDFDSDDLFSAVQLGYDFKTIGQRDSRLQLLLWHSDAVRSGALPEGMGASITIEQELADDDVTVFTRIAWSDGGAATVDALVSGGIAWHRGDGDLLGAAAGCGRGSGRGHAIQGVLECFYRWQLREGFHITPDIQMLAGEGFNDSPGLRFTTGIRCGLDF
jgi:porin